ncbi:MAG: bifunctional metallophosphatase/5'-nucleotidase [Ignavibacteria bacterium]|nr:bifunctional metallophosphatase/5'-nucleotidase [Ignavibacteria bacterium]
MKHSLIRRLILAICLLPAAAGLLTAQETDRVVLTFLHYNDFHSQNLPTSISKTDSTGAKISVSVGGSAVLKATIDRERALHPGAILLHAGDDFQGTPVSSVTKGASQIELLELIQPDVMTLGNHEFDYGAANLRRLLPLVTFPVVSANLWDKTTGAPFVPRYRMLEREGLRIGVIGLAPMELKTLSLRENVKDLDVLDAAMVVRQTAAELRKNFGAEVIVVLSHMGVENDTALARGVPGIDAIVGGHSHTPLFKPIRINDTWVAQAGAKGRWLGRLQLTYDRMKKMVVSGYGTLIETVGRNVTPDPVVAARVRELEAKVDSGFAEVIGTLENDWTRSNGPRESNIGNWQADALRAHAQTDIGLQNSGGIRKDLAAGPVTLRDMWEISPFGNEVVVFSVSGAQLLTMFELQGAKEREFCQVSGVSYSYDRTQPAGTALTLRVDGKPVEPSRMYRVATNSFVGGHLHDFFNLPEADIPVTALMPAVSDRDVFIEAVRAQKRVRSAVEGRITIIGVESK